MKYFIENLIILIFIPFFNFAQHANTLLDNFKIHTLENLSGTDTNFADLQFLKNVLKDKRIVLLGEQSHGDGATFDAKVKLVKFLHQEMDFELICFESGMFDNYYAFSSISNVDFSNSPIKESVFDFWSQCKEFQPLTKYIHQQKNTKNPLMLAGFDCQEGMYFSEHFYETLKKNYTSKWNLTEDEDVALQLAIETNGDDLMNSNEDSVLFFKGVSKVLKMMNSTSFESSESSKMCKQVFKSWIGYLHYNFEERSGKKAIIQNPRDSLMSNNLIELAKIFPDKKIICWGASYHFAEQIQDVKVTPLSVASMQKLGDNGITEINSAENYYSEANTMGMHLNKEFGNKVYSIAFSSFDGEFGILGGEKHNLNEIAPPMGSLEYELVKQNIPLAFIELNNSVSKITPFYLSALGNVPMKANWDKVFDATIFIKTSFMPHLDIIKPQVFSNMDSILFNDAQTQDSLKMVIDKNTKMGINYAQIRIIKSGKLALSNSSGQFNLDVENCNPQDKIELSCMGFRSDTISVKNYLRNKLFELKSISIQLNEVKIVSNKLSAIEIVKRAERKIKLNYMQQEYTQNFIYRYTSMKEDTLNLKKEITTSVFNKNGIQSGKIPKTTMVKLNERIVNPSNRKDNGWGEYDINSKAFNSNVLTIKSNPLHRFKYYSYKINDIIVYEGRKVFEIGFTCVKPTRAATGLGSSPINSSGKIYIDVENFAVVKYTQEVFCKPTKQNENNFERTNSHVHQIVETFTNYNGKYYPIFFSYIQISKETNNLSSKVIKSYYSTEYKNTDILIENEMHVRNESKDDFERKCINFLSDEYDTIYQTFN